MLALNMIPVVGWFIAAAVCIIAAIPMYFLWNALAPIYFYWLPMIYLDLPYWHIVGLMWLLISLRQLLLPSFGTTVNTTKEKS
jgi:hypothetical protein